jgi:hypothetical protein
MAFLKDKDMVELACSSEERVLENKGGNTPPLHPSCGRLKKGSDEKSVKTLHALALR